MSTNVYIKQFLRNITGTSNVQVRSESEKN